jgi:predicted nucleic acid-binding protein
VPVVLEVLHSARNEDEYEEELTETFAPLHWLPFGEDAAARSFDIQRALARATHGAHRIPTVDYFVAAIAEVAGEDVLLWHADRDLSRLCEFVGQAHEHESLRKR